MPELADVEGFRRVFNDNARGLVRAVHVNDPQVVRRTTVRALFDTLRGRWFGAARRHGKWLIAPLTGRRSGTAVLLHFGMTGELVWADQGEEQHRHDRVVFEFDHGQLRYQDMRRLEMDEILWRARIHPRTTSSAIGGKDCARLHARMRTVLRQSAEAGRVPPHRSWLTGHRDDSPGHCPRCGASLSHGKVGGRSGVWCPERQPEPNGWERP